MLIGAHIGLGCLWIALLVVVVLALCRAARRGDAELERDAALERTIRRAETDAPPAPSRITSSA